MLEETKVFDSDSYQEIYANKEDIANNVSDSSLKTALVCAALEGAISYHMADEFIIALNLRDI